MRKVKEEEKEKGERGGGHVKRMMSRRYSGRQQSYHSPTGISHVSHKLWM